MTENDVYIEGSTYGQWATEQTISGILNAASTNVRLSGQQNQILLKILEASSKKLPIDFGPLVAEAKKQSMYAKEQADATNRGAVEAEKANKKSDENAKTTENQNATIIQKLTGLDRLRAEFKNNTLSPREARRYNQSNLDKMDEQNRLIQDLKQQGDRLGLRPREEQSNLALLAAGGYNAYKALTDNIPLSGSIAKLLDGDAGGLVGVGAAAVGAEASAREVLYGQMEGRYDFATEIRQSGLLSALGEVQQSFTDIANTVNESNMTLQEAAEFTRQFSRSVGVVGVTESLRFVKEMAYSRDMMGQYGMSFAQVATISGTYMDTLERLGMLETMNETSRNQGMNSFMDAVQSTAQTLKVSMEESAKMISSYLGRDDISAMIMTAAGGLSEDMQVQIGQMGNMGPLGEIIAMGAIDPSRFAQTDEYRALMNPALSGIRGIIEQMTAELAAGGNAGDITARYTQQMADIIANDPVVGQLVSIGDDFTIKMVAGLKQLSQTAEDATTRTDFSQATLEAERLERQRQDLQRQKDVAWETAVSGLIDHMQDSGQLVSILNSEVGKLGEQIKLITESTIAFQSSLAVLLTGSITSMNYIREQSLSFGSWISGFFNNNDQDRGEESSRYASEISDSLARSIDQQLTAGTNGLSALEIDRFLANNNLQDNADAKNYLIARNNELTSDRGTLGLMPMSFQMEVASSSQQYRAQMAADMLLNASDNILTNGVMEVDASGNIDRILAEELTAYNETLETLRDNTLGLTTDQIKTIINETMATLNDDLKNTKDVSTQADIARLIGALDSFVRSVN